MRSIKIYLLLSIFSGLIAQVASEHLYYGASSLSMAGSDIAIPKSSWSMFVNPAGIAEQKTLSLVASSESLFGQDYFSHSLFGILFRVPKEDKDITLGRRTVDKKVLRQEPSNTTGDW